MATEIGTRIKRARERKRWSQRQLAEALKVDRKTVDNWENHRTSPRSSIGAIEEVLGVSLDDDAPEPDILPPGVRDDIRRGASSPEAAAHLEELFEAFARGEPLPVKKRRATG